jgi:sugar O-acyltransferase (sialic acid O-acetyltransferase NeuD family)
MKLVIVGAGGFGREIYWYAMDAAAAGSTAKVYGFTDANPRALDGFDIAAPVLGDLAELAVEPDMAFVIAVGDPVVRMRLAGTVSQLGGSLATVIHPTAYVAPDARLGAGCVVCPFAFVGTATSIGENTALNTYASVGHDADVGAHSVLSPYATVNGGVRLGLGVFLGTHATVTPRLRVGASSKVGAGSVVMRDVPVGSLAVGSPARSRAMFAVSPAG